MVQPVNAPFFRTCPFCKRVNISISHYGTGTVSCTCGVAIPIKANKWESLHDAAEWWNDEVDEMQKARQEVEDDGEA